MLINKDYKYAYPFGAVAGPVITIISGNYDGLVVHLKSSHIEITQITESHEYKLHYDYKILRLWKSSTMKLENGIKLCNDDQQFIYELILSFIKYTN